MTKPILFLSDLGLRDEFVGVCHSVIAKIAPGATVIDLSHGVATLDIRRGALALAESIAYAPEDAVLLGVIDPGVGTSRKAIAVETASERVLIGPDNGLLSLAWRAVGGATRAFEISSPEILLSPVSRVFHGRDVFAPAAAHVAAGVPAEKLGPELDPAGLVYVHLPEPEIAPGEIGCEILDVDRFGNVRLNVRSAGLDAAGLGQTTSLKIGTSVTSTPARRAQTYSEVAAGEFAVIEDAWGWVTVIRFEASAADELGVRSGDPVWVLALD